MSETIAYSHEPELPVSDEVIQTVPPPYTVTPFGEGMLIGDIEAPPYKVNRVNRFLRELSSHAACGYNLGVEDFCQEYPFKVFARMLAFGSLEINYASAYYSSLLVYNTKYDVIRANLRNYFISPQAKQRVHVALRQLYLAVKRVRTIVPMRRWTPETGMFNFIYPALIRDKLPAETRIRAPVQAVPSFVNQRASKKFSAKKRRLYEERVRGNTIYTIDPEGDIVFAAQPEVPRLLWDDEGVEYILIEARDLFHEHGIVPFGSIASQVISGSILNITGEFVSVPDAVAECVTNETLITIARNSGLFPKRDFSGEPELRTRLTEQLNEFITILETSYPISETEILAFFIFDEATPHFGHDGCEDCRKYNHSKYLLAIPFPPTFDEWDDEHIWYEIGDYYVTLCEIVNIAEASITGDPTPAIHQIIAVLQDPTRLRNDRAEAHGGAFSTVRHVMGAISDIHGITNAVSTFIRSVHDRFSTAVAFVTDWAPIVGGVATFVLFAILGKIYENNSTALTLIGALSALFGTIVGGLVGIDVTVIAKMQQFGISLFDLILHPGVLTNARAEGVQAMRRNNFIAPNNPFNLVPWSRAGERNAEQLPAYRRFVDAMQGVEQMRRPGDDGFDELIDVAELHSGGIEHVLHLFASLFPSVDTVRSIANLRTLYLAAKDIGSIARFLFEFLPECVQNLFLTHYPKLATAFYAANPRWV